MNITIPAMTDDEYFWEPVPDSWSDDYHHSGDAAAAIAAFDAGADARRAALISADDVALDQVGRSTYPDGGDPEEPFIEIVWCVNQELLNHAAEVALLRDLYRARQV